jgi:ADP-ribosylglycohydrolase
MFPTLDQLRTRLHAVLHDKQSQGHDTADLPAQLDALPASYDALWQFAQEIANLPLRAGWPYVEPNDLNEIWAECDPNRPLDTLGTLDVEDLSRRVEAAFLGSVCGCVLGKPLEINPTLDELRTALEKTGDWPLRDYISESTLNELRGRHESWPHTTRENIHFVEPDDDMNYTILGMLVLEKYGTGFTKENLRDAWLHHLTLNTTWGPERIVLAKAAVGHVFAEGKTPVEDWSAVFNWGDELCGAQIRADAYGYAAAGRPALAAELAWRDSSFTHRRTGVYATMWRAAAIAAAPCVDNPLEMFRIANRFVPQRSRFYQTVATALTEVEQSSDWLDGYNRIHDKYGEYSHCRVYQESGTLINTLRWAESVGDGICKQVSQGNDTDSYGATSGSLLGMYFGPGHLEERWLSPFNDDIHSGLAWFFERSLSQLARRMGQLPVRVSNP